MRNEKLKMLALPALTIRLPATHGVGQAGEQPSGESTNYGSRLAFHVFTPHDDHPSGDGSVSI
ncbi:MAG: hypothetical protein IIA61_12835 [Candidatus Marinimicrobia bacterium]|nr:hypothetical protein [Candidatus Neomarinimicrobiota bacterium]